jgi:Tfp pilus assembly protein PilF
MKSIVSMLLIIPAICSLCGCGGSHSPPNDSLTKAPAQNTELARQENEIAFNLIQQGKYDKAQEHIVRALSADPLYGPAHNNRGLIYYYTDRLYLAAWEFDNAIKLMPYQSEPRNNLGLVMERAGKLNEAADSFAKARQMEPENPQYIGNLARARIRRGDNDDQTRELLEELSQKDDRPDWVEWAKTKLQRLSREEPSATSHNSVSN